jgi:hypothetical protein
MDEKNKYYITDNIFRYNNKLYVQNSFDIKKINKNNWIKFLQEYGWEKLPKYWNQKLNIKKNYFAILDCGGNGDCLFHCISEAINKPYDLSSQLVDTKYLRKITSEKINENNFSLILENYKIEKENNEFLGEWDPDMIENYKELQQEIQKCGNNFWGDHILLQLLQQELDINIIIFKTNMVDILFEENQYDNLEIQFLDEKNEKTVILYYISDYHYQLIGYFNGNTIETCFYKENIPEELTKIIYS